jgi:hypothetical protein
VVQIAGMIPGFGFIENKAEMFIGRTALRILILKAANPLLRYGSAQKFFDSAVTRATSAHPGEANLALEACGKRVVGVGQLKPDANRAAGGVKHLIDHRHDCSVLATNFRINLR